MDPSNDYIIMNKWVVWLEPHHSLHLIKFHSHGLIINGIQMNDDDCCFLVIMHFLCIIMNSFKDNINIYLGSTTYKNNLFANFKKLEQKIIIFIIGEKNLYL